MGRQKKSRTQRMAESFGESFRMGKARVGMTNLEIANAIGLSSQAALKRRRDDPGEFTVREILTLGITLHWTEEEFLGVIRAEVQRIKQRHDMDILLRAIAPAARKRQEARRQTEMGKSRINAALARRGIPFRVV